MASASRPWSARATVCARMLAAVGIAVVLLGLWPPGAEAKPWAWLGVRIRDMSEQEMESVSARHGVREGFGVVIVEVLEDTPAARASMRNGDIVVALNGRPVTDTRMLQRLIAATGVDQEVRARRPAPGGPAPARGPSQLHAAAAWWESAWPWSSASLCARSIPRSRRGPRLSVDAPAVGAVFPSTAAARAGLEVGDAIVQINDHAVLTREAVREALADLDPDKPSASSSSGESNG